jgi:hypothetical protein
VEAVDVLVGRDLVDDFLFVKTVNSLFRDFTLACNSCLEDKTLVVGLFFSVDVNGRSERFLCSCDLFFPYFSLIIPVF